MPYPLILGGLSCLYRVRHFVIMFFGRTLHASDLKTQGSIYVRIKFILRMRMCTKCWATLN